MPVPPDPNLPDSIVIGQFSGIKTTLAPERLSGSELGRALNVDIDDAGQIRRRRGQTQVDPSSWHSINTLEGKAYGVKDGILGIIRPDYSFKVLYGVGTAPICYTAVAGDVYFSGIASSGVVTDEEEVLPWGITDGQGQWLSPVLQPTETLGAVSGRLLGDPPRATSIEAYKGRIYLAVGKVMWTTELYTYHVVDRTRGFIQFEHDITLIMAVGDGLYVGTTGGLYFLQGVFGSFKLTQITDDSVLPRSGTFVPTDLIHPSALNAPIPTGMAAVMMTAAGILAGLDGGNVFNLTHGRVEFPRAINAAVLFRQDQGVNSYVAAIDSAGGIASTARFGDFVDAEIIRASQRGD